MSKKPYDEKLVAGGMGGFLNPPGHPAHQFHVETGRKDNPNSLESLESAVESTWHSPAMIARVKDLLKQWETNKKPISNPDVQDWIAQVLGYFKDCFVGQNSRGEVSWNVSDLRIDQKIDPTLNADKHAGVHLIRKYYPEFTPTPEHFKHAYWGTKQAIS